MIRAAEQQQQQQQQRIDTRDGQLRVNSENIESPNQNEFRPFRSSDPPPLIPTSSFSMGSSGPPPLIPISSLSSLSAIPRPVLSACSKTTPPGATIGLVLQPSHPLSPSTLFPSTVFPLVFLPQIARKGPVVTNPILKQSPVSLSARKMPVPEFWFQSPLSPQPISTDVKKDSMSDRSQFGNASNADLFHFFHQLMDMMKWIESSENQKSREDASSTFFPSPRGLNSSIVRHHMLKTMVFSVICCKSPQYRPAFSSFLKDGVPFTNNKERPFPQSSTNSTIKDIFVQMNCSTVISKMLNFPFITSRGFDFVKTNREMLLKNY